MGNFFASLSFKEGSQGTFHRKEVVYIAAANLTVGCSAEENLAFLLKLEAV